MEILRFSVVNKALKRMIDDVYYNETPSMVKRDSSSRERMSSQAQLHLDDPAVRELLDHLAEELDPGDELILQLLEYRKFKTLSLELGRRGEERGQRLARGASAHCRCPHCGATR